MKKALVLIMAAAISLSAAGAALAKGDIVEIKGSDTLINMVQVLSEYYMKTNPSVKIAVTGGGSGTGIAALINKKCDIADASRLMKAQELADAAAKGVDPRRVVVAIDALSIVVNEQNPVKKLTVDEIGKIYRGDVKNWKNVGGNDIPITLYGRQSNSGTYDFIKENVLKSEYSPAMKSMNGNAQIVEAIKQDAGGIGYIGVGYAQESTGITVLEVASNPALGYFSPLNIMNIKTGNYPITRPLNQYVNGIPEGNVKDFIEFELSKEGQKIIQQQGFYSIHNEYRKYNCDSVGVKCEAEEAPVVKYSAQGRDGS